MIGPIAILVGASTSERIWLLTFLPFLPPLLGNSAKPKISPNAITNIHLKLSIFTAWIIYLNFFLASFIRHALKKGKICFVPQFLPQFFFTQVEQDVKVKSEAAKTILTRGEVVEIRQNVVWGVCHSGSLNTRTRKKLMTR